MNLSDLDARNIRAVFTDLDETMTDNGRLAPETYSALCSLKQKGFTVVVVTGRPAGWADCLVRVWPLDAVIYETGAGMYVRRADTVHDIVLAPDADAPRLQKIFERLSSKISKLKLAHDQPYRRFDFAIDYAEDPPFLSAEELALVMSELAKESGVTSQFSTAHVNYWLGSHDKATACRHWLDTEGKAHGIAREQCLFSGDSLNDEPLFKFFENSVGVANVKKYLDRLKHKPRYLTTRPSGEGFQEIVKILVAQ
jgi:HAD superfamily hydrolase (TIGR01484 family)